MTNVFKKVAIGAAVALAFTALPASADVPFGGAASGTDPLGHSWTTVLDGSFMLWGEPGYLAGTLAFNPLLGIVGGSPASTSAVGLRFTFLDGSPGIDNVPAIPLLTGSDDTTRMINVTQGYYFVPTVSLLDHRIVFMAPTGMDMDPGDLFFVNIHFDSPVNPADFSFAGNWVAAIPEPETYAMLLAGLGLMGFVARRRKQKFAAA